MQTQRMRLVADHELRLEQAETGRQQERKRYDEALDRMKKVLSQGRNRLSLREEGRDFL